VDCALAAALIAVALILSLLFPGDLPLLNDQIRLIEVALNCNAAGRLADMGLGGSHNFSYGPLPTQFYQLLLLFTHDLPTIVQIRAIFCLVVTAASLWVIANTLNLRCWFAGFVVCTPWVWFHQRDLWDNSFLIPLSCAALAALARWVAGPSRFNSLALAVATAALPLIHLTGLAMTAAIGMTLLARPKQLRQHLSWIVLGIAIACSSSVSYITFTARQTVDRLALRVAGYDSAPADPQQAREYRLGARLQRVRSALHIVRCGVMLTGPLEVAGLDSHTRADRWARRLGWVSLIIHGWIAVGVACAGVTLVTRSPTINPCRRVLALAALTAIVSLAVMMATVQSKPFIHYFHGVMAAVAFLAWLGVEQLGKLKWSGVVLTATPAAAGVACTVLALVSIHQSQGGRGLFGPLIGNLQEVARMLHGRNDSLGYTDHPQIAAAPSALRLVRRLAGDRARTAPHAKIAVVRFANRFAGDGRVTVDFVDSVPNDLHAFDLAPPP
jgi:hypothetical protein